MTLCSGVLAGGVIQFLFQIPFFMEEENYLPNSILISDIQRSSGSVFLMVSRPHGTAVYQINVFIDTIFASFLPSGSVSYLFFADRLMEFPLGFLPLPLEWLPFPSLSGTGLSGKDGRIEGDAFFYVPSGSSSAFLLWWD